MSSSPHHSRIGAWARLRNYFLTGLVIAAPLFLTIYITRTIVDWIDGWVTPFVPATYRPDTYFIYVPGFGVIVALVFITLLGFLVANIVGRRLVHFGESLVARMPVVSNIYAGLKQIFETAVSTKSKPFKTVGLAEFPRKGMWALVFIVGDTEGEVAQKFPGGDGEGDILNVFVPTTPTPLSGYLVFVRREDVVILDMSVEEAAKMVISAGIVTPEFAPETGTVIGPMSLPDAEQRAVQGLARDEKKERVNPPSAA